jgi:hypothetical protein
MTIALLSFLGICSLGVVIGNFVLTVRAFDKYDSLDIEAQRKLERIDNYMTLVRSFSAEDLNKLGELSQEEISCFNAIRDRAVLIQKIREKI